MHTAPLDGGLDSSSLDAMSDAPSTDAPASDAGSNPATGFANDYLNTYCHLLFSCTGQFGDDIRALKHAAESEEVCRTSAGRLILAGEHGVAANVARVGSGTLTFDSAAAAECLSSFACTDIEDGPLRGSACDRVFDGIVATGESCTFNEACAGIDAHCASETGTCPGTCTATAALGSPCTFREECSTNGGTQAVDCRFVDTSVICVAIERVTAAMGESCVEMLSGTTLTTPICNEGLYCPYEGTGAGTCQPIAASGGACTSDQQCPGTEACGAGGVCVSPPTMLDSAGGDCSDDNVAVCNAFYGLICNASGVCVTGGDGTLGSACVRDDFSLPCNEGLTCDTSTQACVVQRADGVGCASSNECLNGYCTYDAPGGGVCAGACL